MRRRLIDFYSSQGKGIISLNKKSSVTATIDDQINEASGTEITTDHLDYDVQSITTGPGDDYALIKAICNINLSLYFLVNKTQCEAQTSIIQNMRKEELIDLVKSNGEHLKLSKYPSILQANTILEERATYYLGIVEEKDGKKVLIPVLNKNSDEYISFMKSRKTKKHKTVKKCKLPGVDKDKKSRISSKPNSDCPVKKKGSSSKKSISSSKKIKSADASHAKLFTLPPLTKRRPLDLV